MQFDLDDEQSDIRDIVRRFTEQEITPNAEAWDEQEYFPREIYTKMADLGLMGMATPEMYGGSELSRLVGAIVYEELAKGEMATAVRPAMVDSGTWRLPRSCGMAKAMTPP